MQCAEFKSTLTPNQGTGDQRNAAPAENGTAANGTYAAAPMAGAAPEFESASKMPPALPAAALERPHQNGYTNGYGSPSPVPEAGPAGASCPSGGTSRSASTPFPAFQPGAVQAASSRLPPPPPMGSGQTPPPPGGNNTPPRRPGEIPQGSPSSSPPGHTGVNHGAHAAVGSSPSKRRSNPNTRKDASASRIDPEQVPRPVGLPEAAKEEGGKVFETNKYHVPPPATSVHTIVDKGNASCEFMRSTVNQMPAYPSTANTTHVPMAIVCQPFAELAPNEEPVPLVDYGEPGPLRCTRCRAYVNPHFVWSSGGKEATCNFCAQRMEVPMDYFCALDEHNKRRDQAEKPELRRGTVDYVAPSDYSDVVPGLPGVLFVLDASQLSVQSGFFQQVLWTLRSLLAFLEPNSRIGLVTFDHTLHFYAFQRGLEEARQIIMADIEDPFVPCGADVLCIDPQDEGFAGQFESLLDHLPEQFANTKCDQSIGCAALKAATDLMASRGGGHVLMFHAMLPNTGVGALRNRDDIRLYGTPEGVGLYVPQQPALFDSITAECLSKGVAVTAFLAPPLGVYIDAASLSVVPRRTGGEVHFMVGFTPTQDGEKLHYLVSRMVMQATAYSCILRLRCGKGLQVDSMYATWDPEVIDQSTFQVSRMGPDSTAVFVLTHTERIEGQKHAYFQAACLYTDRFARRLIRVHTLQLPVTSSLSNIFRYTEVDCVTNVLIKQAAICAIKGDMSFKERLTKSCVDMLHAYRCNCASTTASGQLILPESLKLLPLYVGSLRKMPAFRSGSDVRMDERVCGLCNILSLPIAQSAMLIYPRVYPVAPLNEKAGLTTGVGTNVHIPQTVASSYDRLAKDGVHLMDNGVNLALHVCGEVTLDTLVRIFGVTSYREVPDSFAAALSPEADVSEDLARILAIVGQIRKDRSRQPWTPLKLVLPGTPEEAKLQSLFAEDRVAGEMQYVDFLCHIHKLVQNKAAY